MLTISLKSNILRLNSVDSTNNFLANLVQASNIPNGTVVVTERQTNGRGQRGSSWTSTENQSLTFSFYIDNSQLSPWEISMRTALGVYTYIQQKSNTAKVEIKWPNDIRLNDKKCAGILIENRINRNQVKTIVGVGINILNETIDAPLATSLAMEQMHELGTLEEELDKLLNSLEQSLNTIAPAKNGYVQKLFGYQTFQKYLYEHNEVYARIIDITEEGKAVFEFENNFRKKLDLKEIKLLT